MSELVTNTVVIGAGPGGYPAAIRLAQLGIDTIVIEREKLGGTCLNVGCIPSKALINAAGSYKSLQKEGAAMGLSFSELSINWKDTIAWKNDIVKKYVSGIQILFKGNGVRQVKGIGTILSPNEVEVSGAESVKIRCEHIIIATGSKVIELPSFPFDHEYIVDSTDLLALETIPESMIILGGGVIGMELGTVFGCLGCQVTVVEMLPTILPNCEEEAIRIIEREFKKMGGVIHTQARATACKTSSQGVVLSYEKDGKEEQIEAKMLAVTVGRKSNFDELNLDVLGLQMNRDKIVVNDQMQTSVPNVYAVGDIVDGPMLAHKATAEGVLAAEVIAGEKVSREDIQVIPDVVYTKPEIASVGVSESVAKEKGISVKVGKFPLAALGRSATTNESLGYIKYIADAETDQVIGATIVCNRASDLISESALAVEMGASLDDIALTIHPHPSFGEGHMESAAAALKKAIHIVNK
ncbi:MAG: dihydrolipoyl dehydrogenase [SAR324 cluster bacterium]|nr:dihydrolipoyl dehydrogenase [SAR324 cluster bacterium]